jgi:hypothetical protein
MSVPDPNLTSTAYDDLSFFSLFRRKFKPVRSYLWQTMRRHEPVLP